jgi:hypothetical protein
MAAMQPQVQPEEDLQLAFSPFFVEHMTAFEVWLDFGGGTNSLGRMEDPCQFCNAHGMAVTQRDLPLYLPIVLQVRSGQRRVSHHSSHFFFSFPLFSFSLFSHILFFPIFSFILLVFLYIIIYYYSSSLLPFFSLFSMVFSVRVSTVPLCRTGPQLPRNPGASISNAPSTSVTALASLCVFGGSGGELVSARGHFPIHSKVAQQSLPGDQTSAGGHLGSDSGIRPQVRMKMQPL